ncbi:EAL domain-containing protein [Silanimonas sp.]|jgi:EAL domain-containing protein (putative c-di-GMP-specific phosphodiesterase class I)|uniref:EAL domain-containing protein n=1 Tax=Silanimonas sp. TaxID=1929290 RepID=UPI0037C8E767
MSAEIRLQPGEVLFREGDPPTTAFILDEGQVEIRATQRGHEVVLALLGPGAIIGEMAVIDAAPRTATAVALSACRLIALDRAQIAERIEGADPVIRALLQGTLQRYRSALAALQGGTAKASSVEVPDEAAGVGKMRLESQLRAALNVGGLDVRYQPLLHVAEGRIAGFEALVRWTNPERGPISPAEFVALAEETSLIVPVGEYVFDTACAAAREFIDAAGRPLFVAVNVSARQLRESGLLERVIARVDAAGLPRGSIKIEITESQAMNPVLMQGFIALCHGHGVKVALDDFGTGYSHLTQMHLLPFDTLKIDQGFVQNMLTDARSMAIVETIVAMAKSLDASIVVEGIESEAQLAVLKRLGCDYAQGWLVGKPQTRDELLTRAEDLFT